MSRHGDAGAHRAWHSTRPWTKRQHEPRVVPVVAARRDLPDLSAVLPGQRCRRHRRPGGHRSASRLPPVAGRGCDLAEPHLPVADGGFRLRRGRLHRRGSHVRHSGGSRPSGAGVPWPRPEAAARLRSEPLLRPASVVHRQPQRPAQCEARLVSMGRSRRKPGPAQQLAERIRTSICATTHAIPTFSRETIPTIACCAAIPPTSRRPTRAQRPCAPSPTATTSGF